MNRRSLRRTTGVLASVGIAALVPSSVLAQQGPILTPVPVFHLQNGQNAGPQEAQGGPGAEQMTSTWVTGPDGNVYVVTIYMSSKVSDEDGPWQCKCSSVALKADGAPELVADQVQLTDYDGDRPCNHPIAASDGKNVVWLYGSDKNNQANVSTYVSAVNHMCEPIAEHKRISQNANNNEGAPDIKFVSGQYFLGGYLSTGGNDVSYAVGLMVTDLGGGLIEINKHWEGGVKGVVTPANIGRPAIATNGGDYGLFCAAKGDNRPPEDGVQCAMINSMDGSIMFKQIVAASQPGEQIYMNQPSVGALDNGRFAVHVLESSGQGKINNEKGSNTPHSYVIEPLVDSFLIKDHKVGMGIYPTHSAICAGKYGTSGARHFGIMGASNTGNGQPGLQFLSYDTTTGIAQDASMNFWSIGWYGDSAKLANMYGQNPNTQGREFLRCIGDVPNPGYGQPNGYLPHVKTFFVTPHAGRIDGEEKNSAWLSFVAGETSEVAAPAPPADPGSIQTGPNPGTGDSTPPAPAPADDPVPGGSDDKGPAVLTPPSSGCACEAAGSGTRDLGGATGLALLGLAGLALSVRRRKGG